MTRLNYPDIAAPSLRPLVERIEAERNGNVPNLYRMLLHSPPIAEGWLHLLTAIRQRSQLGARDLEMVVLYVAALNGADYEFNAHLGFARDAGLSEAEIDGLRDHDSYTFDARDQALLQYAAAMTQSLRVPEQVFERMRALLNDRMMVELTVTIAAYNMVTRFQEALEVGKE